MPMGSGIENGPMGWRLRVMSHEHWERIYRTKDPTRVSWYQPEARLSLELIRRVAPDLSAPIIDVGGGASTLVDGLLAAGYRHLTVLDLSPTALAVARQRLGARAGLVTWLAADVRDVALPATRCTRSLARASESSTTCGRTTRRRPGPPKRLCTASAA